jgi:hypothetical protein
MTTARNSRSRRILAIAATLALAAGARASAHRLDEYLQAARIGIDPLGVTIELDLTPGLAVGTRVVAEIDTDRDGSISTVERRAYAARVLRDISVDLDARALTLVLMDTDASPVTALTHGDGTIRLRATATVLAPTAGEHRLRYRNTHHADVGVYLANALVPSTDRVVVLDQQRDANQRELVVHYALRDRVSRAWLPFALSLTVTLLVAAFTWKRARRLID